MVAAGQHVLLGMSAEMVTNIITDKEGNKYSVKIPGIIVSGLRQHQFYSKGATKKGIITVIDKDRPRLEIRNTVV